jgi:palmitoyltransferase ZDHHC9/14/18
MEVDEEDGLFSSKVELVPQWKIWEGRNRFCCNGRIIFGPDIPACLIAYGLIVVPVSLWLWFIVTDLAQRTTIFVLVACVIAALLPLALLTITGVTDPGMIPRQPPPQLQPGQKQPHAKKVEINGIQHRLKWCNTCNIYRPLGAAHCSICDNCVLRHDHRRQIVVLAGTFTVIYTLWSLSSFVCLTSIGDSAFMFVVSSSSFLFFVISHL